MLVGLMYRKPGKFRVGLTLRTPTNYEISQSSSRSYESILANGYSFAVDYADSEPFTYKIISPLVLSAGLSIFPLEWLTLGADAEYIDWTELEFDSNDPELRSENLLIKTSLFQSVVNFRGGGEISILKYGLKLRGGLVWNPSPFKMDKNTTDYDKIYFTSGIGITIEEYTTIDLSYAYGYWKYGRGTGDLFTALNALGTRESIHTNNLNVTLIYRF
jgi:long-subunit fatty acid transport protein